MDPFEVLARPSRYTHFSATQRIHQDRGIFTAANVTLSHIVLTLKHAGYLKKRLCQRGVEVKILINVPGELWVGLQTCVIFVQRTQRVQSRSCYAVRPS